MQLMPDTAALTAGDDKLKRDTAKIQEPAYNLRLGQDYLTMLMERWTSYDILRTVASYNGGPGSVLKTLERVGANADPLMIIESLPAQETRDYVEKVMAAYWTYRRQWGLDTPTLDALVRGERIIDARLDLVQPDPIGALLTAQAVQGGQP
jgi:soluble lytic murein transglycosylase-like protein